MKRIKPAETFRRWFEGHRTPSSSPAPNGIYDISPDYDQQVMTGEGSYEKNVSYIKRLIGKNKDILLREFTLAHGMRAFVVLVDGMCNKVQVESSIILCSRRYAEQSCENKFDIADTLAQVFGASEMSRNDSLSDGYLSALSGDVLVVVEGETQAFIMGMRAIQSRSVDESPNDASIRAPHESFTETIRINTALLRRRLCDPNLVIEMTTAGLRSHTSVGICYILGLTNETLVQDVRERISNISIDIIGDSGKLEQLIENDAMSVFPQMDGTELPDTAAAALCSGQVVILVNGSPYALILPTTAADLMQVSEDKYRRWTHSMPVKILRVICAFISVFAPALYIATISYHPGILPTALLLLTASNRLSVPFSAVIEVLLMEFALEMLREASTRMPKNISAALSIVGGIIIGDAAIQAGLVSPLLIITVGVATMASFTTPSYSFASSLRLVKYFFIFASAVLGMFGLVAAVILVLSNISLLNAFGTSFTAPLAPNQPRGLLRFLFEMPARMHTTRPRAYKAQDLFRMPPESEVSADE